MVRAKEDTPEAFADIIVDIAKLRDYCLSENHPRGRHKARIFRSRLGLSADHADVLRQALLDAARNKLDLLRPIGADEFGRRYALDFEISTTLGTAMLRSSWIVRTGQDVLRLVSCYVR